MRIWLKYVYGAGKDGILLKDGNLSKKRETIETTEIRINRNDRKTVKILLKYGKCWKDKNLTKIRKMLESDRNIGKMRKMLKDVNTENFG